MATCTEKIRKEVCTGCDACVNICPVEAIAMESDKEGFWYPSINEGKCIQCEKCVDVCPVVNANQPLKACGEGMLWEKRPFAAYAAWSLDRDIRYHSTSGGIFSELALSVLSDGGHVCGAIYDSKHMVKHALIDEKRDLAMLRQSKYVQSDMGDIYQKVKCLLNAGETVLFCGSPCQCAGIFHYCKECDADMVNLYLVDFICIGVNSPKVYRKFLDEMEDEYQSNVKRVWFKNKIYGWNRFSTKIEFENGICYLQDRYHDAYVRGYIEERLFIRPSCTHCQFKGFQRFSDMVLGDFWGVQLEDDSQNSDGGTSVVMVCTEKGKNLWDCIASNIYKEEKCLNDVVAGNSCFYHSVQHGVHRDQFMKDLDKIPVRDNIMRFLAKK